jgi:5-methylcytosine-specific restriction endonuclease McrA
LQQEAGIPHRPEIHRWYTTASWQRRRRHQLRIEPLCRFCLEVGRVTPATVADHVVPHAGDYAAFRLGSLRSLCKACHDSLDGRNRAPVRSRSPVRADGTPSDPQHPWNVVQPPK